MSFVAYTGRRGKLNSEGESGLTLNAYRIDQSLRERDFRWFVSKLHITGWREEGVQFIQKLLGLQNSTKGSTQLFTE